MNDFAPTARTRRGKGPRTKKKARRRQREILAAQDAERRRARQSRHDLRGATE